MALSKLQVEETLELFVNNFLHETAGVNRMRLFQWFGDVFGKGIVEWHDLALGIMREKNANEEVVFEFKQLVEAKRERGACYEYRELQEDDLKMVRELLNHAFDTILTEFDDRHLKKFINGYSLVLCQDLVQVKMSFFSF